jgi:PAS domain S-box-containing protein
MNDHATFQCHYRPLFVILSYTISVLGAYCSLQWASQISIARGRARAVWLAGAAIAMGGGAIWSMHFIAMLACRLPVPVAYDFPVTLASLLLAVVATGTGLHVVSRAGAGYRRLVAGGVLTGLGVAGMHYTGMAAMRMPTRTTYQPWIVAASVVIAIVAATAAFWIAFHLGSGWQRRASSLVMGVAVCGMHYTGMAAAVFVATAGASPSEAHSALQSDDLAYMVFGVTLCILALLSIGGRAVEQRRAEDLQRVHAELEKQVADRTGELARANEDLRIEITQRERGHAERSRLAAFTADVGGALTRSENLPRALDACARAMVQHLGAGIASIWVVDPKEPFLERRAAAGGLVPESVDRIPVGKFRIGRIAAEGKPRIIDLTSEPLLDDDKGWARQTGMVSFAGYPLTVGGRSLGVMAMCAREPITEPALDAMATVADEIALGIDRERSVESLRASEALTRSIIESMLEGLVITDSSMRIRTVNRAAERIFGYERGELLGQPLTCLIPSGGGAAPLEFMRQAKIRAIGRVTEWRGRRKDGDVFPMELSLFDFWTPEGRHYGGAVKDLSERREVDRLKREFVSTVSHELRTPLTSIRGALGLVVSGTAGPLPAQAKGLLEIALKNSERLALLVNDILDMEKIESGQLEFTMAEFEMAPVLEATVEGNRSYADAYGVILAAENGVPGVQVYADADRLTQAITNLLSNAVKFSPRGETVRLVASRRPGFVRLEIVDRGPGIPEEFRSRIFGRFQQADSSDTRRKGGTGLGLAITRLIVEKLGGRIGFESQIGRGSTFWIELPEAEMQRSAVAAPGVV